MLCLSKKSRHGFGNIFLLLFLVAPFLEKLCPILLKWISRADERMRQEGPAHYVHVVWVHRPDLFCSSLTLINFLSDVNVTASSSFRVVVLLRATSHIASTFSGSSGMSDDDDSNKAFNTRIPRCAVVAERAADSSSVCIVVMATGMITFIPGEHKEQDKVHSQ